MVVPLHLGLTLAVGDTLFVGPQLMLGGASDDDAALVVDLHLLVMQYMLGPVALGAQVDFLGAFFILDAQFVVTPPPGLLWLRKMLRVCSAGKSSGIGVAAFGRQPMTNGLSASASMNPTSTSMPTRGISTLP